MTIDEKGEGFVEVTTPNFVMRGFVPEAESRVYPAKWLSIGGVYFLSHLTSHSIAGTHDGKLTLHVYDSGFAFTNSKDRLLDVNCDDVSLSAEPSEELRNTLPPPFRPGFGRAATFNFTNGISVSATVDGPPAGKIVIRPRIGTGPMPRSYTTVLEERGKKVRIADRSHIAGWIDAAAVSLVPASVMAGETNVTVVAEVRPSHPTLRAQCGPDGDAPEPIHAQTLVCPRDVRLVVVAEEAPDRLAVMGRIPAGRPVRVLDRAGDLTSVFLGESPELPAYPMSTLDRVHVATPTVDLDRCTPTTAFPFPLPEPSPRTEEIADTIPDAISKMGDDAIPHLREERAIWSVLENHSDFALCYDEGLRKNPELRGEVVARFVIGPKGKVTDVNELESRVPLRSEKVARCVLGDLSSLTFPPPTSKTKTTTVTAYVRLED